MYVVCTHTGVTHRAPGVMEKGLPMFVSVSNTAQPVVVGNIMHAPPCDLVVTPGPVTRLPCQTKAPAIDHPFQPTDGVGERAVRVVHPTPGTVCAYMWSVVGLLVGTVVAYGLHAWQT